MRISTLQYIANNKEKQLRSLLSSHGLRNKPNNINELQEYAKEMGRQIGSEFDAQLLEIHPDYKIFYEHFEKVYEPQIEAAKEESEKNATRILNAAGDKLNLATIQKNTETPALSHSRMFDYIAGAAFTLSIIAVVASFRNNSH